VIIINGNLPVPSGYSRGTEAPRPRSGHSRAGYRMARFKMTPAKFDKAAGLTLIQRSEETAPNPGIYVITRPGRTESADMEVRVGRRGVSFAGPRGQVSAT